MKEPFREHFESGVDRSAGPNACHEWLRGRFKNGYGSVKRRGKDLKTHRVAWELEYGPIPDGLFVCHTCDNPPCCNLKHLFLGTPADNAADMVAKGRQARGWKFSTTKLEENDVRGVRIALAAGLSHRTIAALFGVNPRTIHRIRHYIHWAYVI